MKLPYLSPTSPPDAFPDISTARDYPDGLLAVGGCLSAERLLVAYQRGIFPWFSEGEPIMWWSPNPRTVFRPAAVHIAKRMRRELRQMPYRVTLDTDFTGVMQACATTPRHGQDGTWITQDMLAAYSHLHDLGHAHSIEIWHDTNESSRLVGGLYGISIGRAFFGESMFSHVTNASKFALIYLGQQLARWNFTLLDAQVASDHLFRMGAIEIPRQQFAEELKNNEQYPSKVGKWQFDDDFSITI